MAANRAFHTCCCRRVNSKALNKLTIHHFSAASKAANILNVMYGHSVFGPGWEATPEGFTCMAPANGAAAAEPAASEHGVTPVLAVTHVILREQMTYRCHLRTFHENENGGL